MAIIVVSVSMVVGAYIFVCFRYSSSLRREALVMWHDVVPCNMLHHYEDTTWFIYKIQNANMIF